MRLRAAERQQVAQEGMPRLLWGGRAVCEPLPRQLRSTANFLVWYGQAVHLWPLVVWTGRCETNDAGSL